MELMEQAKLLRGPYQIAMDITNKCNYRCLHCYNASGENFIANDELDDEFLDCIRDIAEIKPYKVWILILHFALLKIILMNLKRSIICAEN